MAIPKKGARTITVKDTRYRWLIRRKSTNSQCDYGIGRVHIAIDHAENPGTTLVIYSDREHPKDWNTKKIIPVVPSDISNWIKQALDLNWQPEQNGPPLSVSIEEGEMKRRT